jgi:hypothetical protein
MTNPIHEHELEEHQAAINAMSEVEWGYFEDQDTR